MITAKPFQLKILVLQTTFKTIYKSKFHLSQILEEKRFVGVLQLWFFSVPLLKYKYNTIIESQAILFLFKICIIYFIKMKFMRTL